MKTTISTLKQLLNIAVKAAIVLVAVLLFLSLGNIIKDSITGYKRNDVDTMKLPLVSSMNEAVLMISQEAMKQQPEEVAKITEKVSLLDRISLSCNLTVILILLIQAGRIIRSVRDNSFMIAGNLEIVRRMSFVIFGWVAVYFILSQVARAMIPFEWIEMSMNIPRPEQGLWMNLLASVNWDALFIGFLIFILSLSLREGVRLKEENQLTI